MSVATVGDPPEPDASYQKQSKKRRGDRTKAVFALFLGLGFLLSSGLALSVAYLAANGEILSRSYNGSRVTIHCRLPQKFLGKIDETDVQIRDRRKLSVHDSTDSDVEDAAIEDVA